MFSALRSWLGGRTLSTRLVFGVTALFLAACAGVAVITAIELHTFLIDRLDSQLPQNQSLSQSLESQRLGEGENGPVQNPEGPKAPGGTLIGTLGAWIYQGKLVAAAEERNPVPVLISPSPEAMKMMLALPPDGRPYSRDLPGLGDYRLIAVRGRNSDVHITGLPLADVNLTVAHLELIEAIVFGVAVVLAALAALGVVRLSLRPLRRVTVTANRVAALPLESGDVEVPHRVPAIDARTEVGQLGAAFNRMLGHVEGALAARQESESRLRQFVADASHELRTPLAGIRSYAELARRSPEEADAAVTRVEQESVRMGRLVDDLLLLARLDSGIPVAHAEVDLTRLALEVTNDARVAGPDHRWALELPGEPVMVVGDGHRLHQVLANLLANARIHTPPGTSVVVRLTPPAAGEVSLSVTDDGPGIPAKLQADVFERFVRGDRARSPREGSTGLGLAIAKAVATAHGGRLELSSQPGRTCFDLRLPAAPSD